MRDVADVTADAVAVDEPLCEACKVHRGLCAFHAQHVLPQLKGPSWPRMIGEPYVCSDPAHEDHVKCMDVPGYPAPRAECGCHHCSQRRWARARAKTEDAEPSVEVKRAQRRNERKLDRARKAASDTKRVKAAKAQARARERLAHGMFGGFSRSRPKRERVA